QEPAAPPVLLDEEPVGIGGLRVAVEAAHVAVRRRRVEVVIELLHVLAVVALGAGDAEEPLLEDRIAAVPQRQREAQAALAIADPEEAVLAPAVGAAARVVVREVGPRVAVGGIVLAHRRPLALREVRAPALPVGLPARVGVEAARLGVEVPHLDKVLTCLMM